MASLSGSGAELFMIDPTGAISLNVNSQLDFETASSYSLTVTAMDGMAEDNNMDTIQESITITVLDASESAAMTLTITRPTDNDNPALLIDSSVAADGSIATSTYVQLNTVFINSSLPAFASGGYGIQVTSSSGRIWLDQERQAELMSNQSLSIMMMSNNITTIYVEPPIAGGSVPFTVSIVDTSFVQQKTKNDSSGFSKIALTVNELFNDNADPVVEAAFMSGLNAAAGAARGQLSSMFQEEMDNLMMMHSNDPDYITRVSNLSTLQTNLPAFETLLQTEMRTYFFGSADEKFEFLLPGNSVATTPLGGANAPGGTLQFLGADIGVKLSGELFNNSVLMQNVRNFEVNGGAVSSAWSDIVHSNFFLDHATARFNYVTPNGQNVKFSGGVTHFGTGTNWKDHTYGGSISLKGNERGPLFPDIGLNANYTPAGNDFMTTLRVQFRW